MQGVPRRMQFLQGSSLEPGLSHLHFDLRHWSQAGEYLALNHKKKETR